MKAKAQNQLPVRKVLAATHSHVIDKKLKVKGIAKQKPTSPGKPEYVVAVVGDSGSASAGTQGAAIAGDHGNASAGFRGTALAGDGGIAMSGSGVQDAATSIIHRTFAIVGTDGTAQSGSDRGGLYGMAIAGDNGTAKAGSLGVAIAGDGEKSMATAGYNGIALAGKYGTAAGKGHLCLALTGGGRKAVAYGSGKDCIAISWVGGEARVGSTDYSGGIAIAYMGNLNLPSGVASAGTGGLIIIAYRDDINDAREPLKFQVGRIDQDYDASGQTLQANTRYTLDANHKFVVAPPPTNRRKRSRKKPAAK